MSQQRNVKNKQTEFKYWDEPIKVEYIVRLDLLLAQWLSSGPPLLVCCISSWITSWAQNSVFPNFVCFPLYSWCSTTVSWLLMCTFFIHVLSNLWVFSWKIHVLYTQKDLFVLSVIISSLSFFSVYFNSSKVNVRPSEPIL